MSSASFREWAHRTQQFAGRWANEKTKSASKTDTKPSKTGTSKKSKKQLEQEKKDKDKILALKARVPTCKLGNWNEVKNLSRVKHDQLQELITVRFEEFTSNFATVKDGMLDMGLTEDQIKASRAFLPHLPKLKEQPVIQVVTSGAGSASPAAEAAGQPMVDDLKAIPKVAEAKDQNDDPKAMQLAKVAGLSSPMTMSSPVGNPTKVELTEYFGKYNWTSVPEPLPNGFNKLLKSGAAVVGLSTTQWKSKTISSKFELLAKFYNQK
jgi:hypothetical protein